jgi:uncharacterized protein (DUF58 family)
MNTKEILKTVRMIDIKTRGLVNNIFGGEYHSVFKGRGMSFAEVREYQFGDEVRFIDWNVSARMDRPYIKVFEEEREQSLLILFDASGSGEFGTQVKTKRMIMIEIAALIAFSAIKNNDKVGILFFTDHVEKFIAPKKGRAHVLRLIRDLIAFEPKHRTTKIAPALEYAFHVLKRRSIVFILSDFIGRDYSKPLKALARKQDVIAVRIYDPHERTIPPIGLVHFEDQETGEQIVVDTASGVFQKELKILFAQQIEEQNRIFIESKVDLVDISTPSDYVEKLIRFFENRVKRFSFS